MEEKDMSKAEKNEKEVKSTKKKSHILLEIIVIILIILSGIFIGNTLRKFYIINTYIAATNEYGAKDNYIEVQYIQDEKDMGIMGYRKGDKTLVKMYSEDNKKTIAYYDRSTQESIVAFEVANDKVALVKQTNIAPIPTIGAIGIEYQEMSAWENFLLALRSKIISEDVTGKGCYKITIDGEFEQWISKETGLIVKATNGYYQDSNGNKKRSYREYSYQFGRVTDEDVKKPDLTGYKIQRD